MLDMLLVDTVYLAFLAWYLGQVWPSEYGKQVYT